MIPLFRPSVGSEEGEAVKRVLESKWIGTGPKTTGFENEFAKYVGSKHAIGVNSATSALDLTLKAFGINSGEVLVPSLTFIATAHVVLYNNAQPVFVDVNRDNFCMNVDDIKNKITKNTRAIIPVHYSGHPCDMNEILEIARENDTIVIEDAAQATGAEYRSRKVGGISDATCFSFEAKKNLTTGDGGMVTLNDEKMADKIKRLRWFGINKDTWQRAQSKYTWYYEVAELGYKAHMNDIQAAIGLVQLKKLDDLNRKRRELFEFYNKELRNLNGIEVPAKRSYVKSAHWNYVLKVKKRDDFINFLKERGIETGVHYMPVHLHPLYGNLIKNGNIPKPNVPVTEKVWKEVVTLPSYADLKRTDMEKVVEAVVDFSKR